MEYAKIGKYVVAKCRNIYCTPCKVNHGWFTCPDPKCGYNDNITLKAFSPDKVGEIIKCECGIKYKVISYDPNISRDVVELEVYEGKKEMKDEATIDDIRDDLQAMDARYMRELHNHMDTIKIVKKLEEKLKVYKQTFLTFCMETDDMDENEAEACFEGWLDNERNKAEKEMK